MTVLKQLQVPPAAERVGAHQELGGFCQQRQDSKDICASAVRCGSQIWCGHCSARREIHFLLLRLQLGAVKDVLFEAGHDFLCILEESSQQLSKAEIQFRAVVVIQYNDHPS